MENPSLEDRMVAAHKLGIVTFQRVGKVAPELLAQMLAETGLFDTMAETMAFLAGYTGEIRRARKANQPNGSLH
jgi:hypothetical protein